MKGEHMPLDEGDRAIVREIAFEAAEVIKSEVIKTLKTELRLHQAECPAIKAIARWPKQMIFLVIGVGLGSGGGVAALLKLLKVF